MTRSTPASYVPHGTPQRRPSSVHMLEAATAAAEPMADDDGSDSNELERHAAPSGGTQASEKTSE